MGRRGPQATDTVNSIVRTGDAEQLTVELGHRWKCSCGDVGEWMGRPSKGVAGPKESTPADLARAVRAWEEHLKEKHPDVVDDGEWLEEARDAAARAVDVDPEKARAARHAARRALAATEYD